MHLTERKESYRRSQNRGREVEERLRGMTIPIGTPL